MIDSLLLLGQSNRKEKIQSLPFPVYYWTVFGLAVAGLIDSIYLSISHYRVYTDIGYQSFCALTRAINCDTVSQSSFSIFLDLPVPVWGVIGYLFFLLLLVPASRSRANPLRMWAVLFLLALAFSIYSIILALISSFLIHSYCIMCIVSYAINFGLLYYCWLVLRRFTTAHFSDALRSDLGHLYAGRRKYGLAFGGFIVFVGAIWLLMSPYWHYQPPVAESTFSTGTTPEGHPWIGAEQPALEIIEFTDYRCFQCRKMNFYLRTLMVRYPEKIRIVHRHFPMDHLVNPLVKEPMHTGAGILALMAIYAAKEGKFWQMHDLLYTLRDSHEIGTRSLAEAVGLDPLGLSRAPRDPEIIGKLRDDLREGLRLGITGTPTFVIDGKVYQGQLPPDIQDRLLQ
jgi:uncharacterized membrane protein/predicted DsbA family dithiol-disulfide isomerase